MDILESLEVRWFLADEHPALAVAQKWFASARPEEDRIDDYLLTNRDDLGFKARMVENQPTKFETKYLIGSLGVVHVAPGVIGKLERWRKLSVALDDTRLKKDRTWRTVEKKRQLRKFAFQSGVVSEVSVEARPDAGAGIELTQLRYRFDENGDFSVAWTLGLEAFGLAAELLQVLQAICLTTLGDGLWPEIDAACSMGYPEWLRSIPEGKRQ